MRAIRILRKHLSDFKVPLSLVLRSETVPLNPGGELLKKQMRETLDWGKALW